MGTIQCRCILFPFNPVPEGAAPVNPVPEGAATVNPVPEGAALRVNIAVMIRFSTFDRPRARGLLAGALLVLASTALADAPLRTAQVRVGPHPMKVEIVETDPQRIRGLMFREKLGRDDGMLFIYEEPAYQSMWMKNTLIPLSVAFIDRDGVILNIEDMEPQTLDSHISAGPASFSIEANKGWFAQKRIKPGDRVTGLPAMKGQPKK